MWDTGNLSASVVYRIKKGLSKQSTVVFCVFVAKMWFVILKEYY